MVLGPSSTALLATIYILITIAAFVIAARVYLRLKIQKRKLLMSDLLMMSAWFAAFTAASFDIILDVKGVLRPEIDYFLTNYRGDIESHEYLLKIMWAGTIPYFTTFYLCKASLLSCYLQLFPRFMKKRRILLWVTIGYCTLSYVATILIQLFFCFPIERNWVHHQTRDHVRADLDKNSVPDHLGVTLFGKHRSLRHTIFNPL